MIDIHIKVNGNDEKELVEALLSIPKQLRHLHNIIGALQEKIMATLDEVLAKVEEGTTVDQSLITLFNGVKAQLDEVLSGTVIPPAVQTKIDAIFAGLESDNAAVSAAVTSGTPAEPEG